MKNLFGKWSSLSNSRKSLYFSAFMIICFFVVLPVFSAHAGWSDEFGEAITQRLVSWVNTVIFEILKIVLAFASLLVYFGAWMVDVMLNQALYRSVLVGTTAADGTTTVSAVELGWRTVRDFCNMFYVFFLLIIAFGTITRSSTYNYKNLLPKFIISLFLINFSRVITEIAIDIGQIFLFGMAAWLGTFSGSSGGGAALTGIVNYFTLQFSGLQTPSFQDIISIFFAVLYTFVLGIMYVILALFLLFRLIVFAVLIIASPFAFFSIVMPQTRRFASEWQGMLINNAISGPVFIFFIYISAMMAKTLTDNPISVTAADGTVSTDVSGLGDTSKMQYLVPTLTVLIPHIVALGMLFMAIPAAKRVGAFGQQYIVGGRGGIGKVAGWGYAGFKLGERSARRAASGAGSSVSRNLDRAQAYHIPGAKTADRGFTWMTNGAKRVPFIGDRVIKSVSADKQATAKEISDTESMLKPLSDKDKVAYYKNQKFSPRQRAVAGQALVNLLAKDSGKDLTDAKIKSLGIDLKKIYGKSQMFGLDTGDVDKYRFDVIDKPADREKKIDKIIEDGKENLIKLDSFKDKSDVEYFLSKMDSTRLSKYINGKTVGERTTAADNMVRSNVTLDAATGVVNTKVANFTAELAKGTAQRFDPIFTDRAGTVDVTAFKGFMDGMAHIKDLTQEQVQDAINADAITKGHLVNSKGVGQKTRELIIDNYEDGGRLGLTRADERTNFIETSKDWKA